MVDESRKLKWKKEKVLRNNQYSIHILFDDDGNKKYTLFYDKNKNLLKIDEYQDGYTLQIDQSTVSVEENGENVAQFAYREVLYPINPYFNLSDLQDLIRQLHKLDLAQIYFGVKKQKFTDTEANENLMNYVHFSRDQTKVSSSLININQKLFKEEDLWLDLGEEISSINKLIKQYQEIEKNCQTINKFLTKLNDKSLEGLQNLFQEDKAKNFSRKDLLQDTGWKLAGAAAELLVVDRLQHLNRSVNFHNVILPFDYGNGEKQNQVDNLLVNENGIFCIEVKSKKIADGIYNFDKEDQQYAYVRQILNHVHAVKRYLLQQGLFVESKYIHPVILIMNRNPAKEKQEFKIINSLPLQVISLADLEGLSENSFGVLPPDKINLISNLLQASTSKEPMYQHYNFLPKLTPSVQAIEQFNKELQSLNNLVSKLTKNLKQYYKVKNYKKLVKGIRLSSAFQYFDSHK